MISSPSDIRRFWSKVAIAGPTECWNWTAACFVSGGYGAFKLKGGTKRAHRIAYFLMKGDLLPGFELLHLCNNPKCCNPNHLVQDTHQANLKQAGAEGKMARYHGPNSKSGLTEEQLIDILTSKDSLRKLGKKYSLDHKTIFRFKKEFQLCPQESSQPLE